jgi:hypothetical protein
MYRRLGLRLSLVVVCLIVFLATLAQAQNVRLTPTSLTFAKTPVGGASAAKSVNVTNTGTVALLITNVATTGDFSANSNCPSSLAPHASCKIFVVFLPTAVGNRTGALTLTDNAPSGQQNVPLSGTGTGSVSVSPTKLNFKNSIVGLASAPQSLLLTNSASNPVSLTNIASSLADFTFQNNCGTQIPASSNCSIAVTFTPTATGARAGTLTFNDGGSPSSFSIPLTGYGIAPKLLSIAVVPANATVNLGATQQYHALGTYNNNQVVDITNSVVWKSADPNIATISSAGLVTGIKGGVTTISATQGKAKTAITGSTSVTIAPALLSITVTPHTANVAAGVAQQFMATGFYNDGSQHDLTANAQWTSSNPSVASVSASGLAATATAGQTSITATVGSFSDFGVLTVTPAAITSISVSPNVVFIGVGSNKQYSATGTFTDGSQRDVTRSVVWSTSSSALATIDSYGLGTSTGDGSAQITATAGTVSGSATMVGIGGGYVSCDARILDMKVLVVTSGQTEADFPAITQALDYMGTPYSVLDIATTGNMIPAGYLANGCHGNFQGVIFGFGGNIYNIHNFSDLYTYEAQFSVRQVNWYSYPDPNFGMSYKGSLPASSTPYNFNYTSDGASLFSYANAVNPVGIVNASIYLGSIANGATPLLTDDSGNVLATLYNTPFAYQYLSLSFDSNPYLTHDLVLSYGLVKWVTQGMFLGQRHTYMTPQVDDYFIDDSEWTPGLDCSTNPDDTGTHIRIAAADLSALLTWQAAKQSNPISQNFILSMAFNGQGTVPGVYPNDDLTSSTQANQAAFNWINHTFDHTNLDSVTYEKAVSEITQNNAVAAQLGFTNFNLANMVTPDISGLRNPDFLQAAADNGVKYVVSDTSRAGEGNPTPNTGIVNQVQPAIFEIPRHPNNLFFNVATPDDWAAEYGCIYPQLGYTYPQILDNISDSFVVNMLKGDIDPQMFHQPNLYAYDGTHSLLGDLMDMTFSKYSNLVSFPVLSLREDAIATEMMNRSLYNSAGLTASYIPHQRIMITATQGATVPVTGLVTDGAETYGGETISHVPLLGGQTVTLPLP